MSKICCSTDNRLELTKKNDHGHQYDTETGQLCCHPSESVAKRPGIREEDHSHDHGHGHEHSHETAGSSAFRLFVQPAISLILLLAAIGLDNYFRQDWFAGWVRLLWYVVAYIPVGLPVIKEAADSIRSKDLFSEFLLMTLATIGAFAIGEYPEAVAVMLFYAVGETFQTLAVSRAKRNIKMLLDQRPDKVTVLQDGKLITKPAEQAVIGDVLQLKPGEKLALDAELLSESASFNTAALTGESKPDTKRKGETVLAGMINLTVVCQVRVTTAYSDSKLSKILKLVQDAASQKAPTELFIRKFSKIYTPIVVYLAIAIALMPAFFVNDYVFSDWLYRALVFLVISCPCALVISIPLGYFGGIGAASKNGILFKGSNFLDALAKVQHVVMDKTGTLTAGVFNIQELFISNEYDRDEILGLVNALESQSTHPIATAIRNYLGEPDAQIRVHNVEEIPGHGLRALANGKELLVGNFKLLDRYNISYDLAPQKIASTVVAIAYDRRYAGYVTIADSVKTDAADAVSKLHKLGVHTTMLSGDKSLVVRQVADQLQINSAYGDLLPEDKVNKVKDIRTEQGLVAFVGDGVNDAPVLAWSDVGIAMGGLGSDAAIETADVVIQDDMPSKIPMAIQIGRQTKRIVLQNIVLAFGVKAVVLILGAGGLATMWEAVFADVGVALLAILNAVRIQRMRFD
ncbi:heavy metal translocating P-type ATPase [Sphingobacterium thalpophilum]|uniref:heavy metal translocating P-type ATPase n=1 Tax=Sphingobacterium thalpophilum TaxID=259 RepID=UPI002D79186F|nr:heavy metal translocating P-type ATPase [Sphingobacterium thalpophilum]